MKNEKSNDLLLFFIGLILLSAGIYMLTKQIHIYTTTFGYGFFGRNMGLVFIPLIIGLIWMFAKPKSIIPKFVIVIGAVLIFSAVIMSTSISFIGTTLFDYLLVIGLIAAGAGILLRVLFRSGNNNKKGDS